MNLKIIGIGEVLWDLLPNGIKLGGAPANFAYHAHALGAETHVITRVGNDDYGREILRRFNGMGLSNGTVQVDEHSPTGTATVKLSGEGLAHFTVEQDVAWDCIAATPGALAAAQKADAICFGTLAQRSERSRQTIQELVAATPEKSLRVLDINFRQKFYSREIIEESLRLADVLKLNDDELPVLVELFGLAEATVDHMCGADTPVRGSTPNKSRGVMETPASHKTKSQIARLAHAFDLRLVALTRGADGSLLYRTADGRWSDCLSRPVKVVDTVGAGDSFTAALVLGLLQNMDLDEVNTLANDVARYVCSQTGATPTLPEEFAGRLAKKVS
jgi:fructokinase